MADGVAVGGIEQKNAARDIAECGGARGIGSDIGMADDIPGGGGAVDKDSILRVAREHIALRRGRAADEIIRCSVRNEDTLESVRSAGVARVVEPALAGGDRIVFAFGVSESKAVPGIVLHADALDRAVRAEHEEAGDLAGLRDELRAVDEDERLAGTKSLSFGVHPFAKELKTALDDFLSLMGWVAEHRAVKVGKGARPEDFPPRELEDYRPPASNTSKGLFRPRKPQPSY